MSQMRDTYISKEKGPKLITTNGYIYQNEEWEKEVKILDKSLDSLSFCLGRSSSPLGSPSLDYFP